MVHKQTHLEYAESPSLKATPNAFAFAAQQRDWFALVNSYVVVTSDPFFTQFCGIAKMRCGTATRSVWRGLDCAKQKKALARFKPCNGNGRNKEVRIVQVALYNMWEQGETLKARTEAEEMA